MAIQRLSPFLPKQNTDGSMSAICTNCFQTLGKVTEDADLQPLEEGHVCEVTLLSTRARKPPISSHSGAE